jgi:glycosyltransferase involved in cell wall biosynthesis
MRLLIVSDHYPPFIGGAQLQTHALAQRMRERGHVVTVATVWQPDLPQTEDDHGVDVRRIRQLRSLGRPRTRLYQPPFPDPLSVFELRKLIRALQPDVIHSAGWFSFSVAAAVGRDRVPLLVSARDYGFSCAVTTLMRRGAICSGPGPAKCVACAVRDYGTPKGSLAAAGVRVSGRLLRSRVSAIHSVSRFVEEIMERDFLRDRAPDVSRHVIPSFNVGAPRPQDAEALRPLPDEPFILFVGALRKVKGVEVLIEAHKRLRAAPPLVLIGTVERDTPPLPEDITVIPGMPRWAVLEAWDRSIFGVMPSVWPEPFGNVMHEAMSRGKAVIGTLPGGHGDIVEDGEHGLLVPSGDVGALAAAMQRLLDDDQLRRRLGAAGRQRSEAFGEQGAVEKFERLYRELAAGR